jgi:dipeptidyl aminopeptidase/acylaminoacyl peptidase
MKTIILILITFLAQIPLSFAKVPIPPEHFAKFPQFRQMVISPTGKYLAASMERDDGIPIVSVFDLKNMAPLSTIEFKREELPGKLTWLNDSRLGMNILMQTGSLDFPVTSGDYYAMNADGTRKEALWGFRNQAGIAVNPEVSVMQILHRLPEDEDHILVAENVLNNPKPAFTKAYKLNIYTGRKRSVATAPIRGARLLADHNANVRFASGVDPDENNKIKIYYRQQNGEDWQLFKSFDEEQGKLTPIAFSPDNQSVYALADIEDPVSGLIELNLQDQKMTTLYRHPLVDIDDVALSHDASLLSARVSPDKTHYEILSDHPVAQWWQKLQNTFPDQTVEVTSTTRDGKNMLVNVSSASNPGDFYLFDTENMQMQFLVKSRPWLDSGEMAEVKPFKMQARDGVELHGYLTLPKGKAENLPLVVHPHGGPHGPRDYWQFNPDAQLLASRGYAVLQLNFRGSGGYGREFMYSGYGKWGAEMQDDLTDATLWAVEQGIADKQRICIYGASYGGYAALMGVTKEPDLYQCAVGYVGVFNLPMMFEEGDIPDSKYGLNFLNKALGEDKEALKKRSPAFNAGQIKADIFLVHGAKDVRVPIEQAESLKQALDKAGHPYEWMVKDKEGHGFYDEGNREEMYQRLLAFLDKNLKRQNQ